MNRKTLITIAQQHLDVSSLDMQDQDDLDFHAVCASSIDAALTAAYLAGYAAALRAAGGSTVDALPTERHTMLGSKWLGKGEAVNWSSDPRAETVVTAPIPEVALTARRWEKARARDLLIPTAIWQRRIA